MQTITRYIYGPTPEEKVRNWQAKLRSEQRVLERDMRQARATLTANSSVLTMVILARWRNEQSPHASEAIS